MPLRTAIIQFKIFIWKRVWGMDIHPTARISLSAKLDRTYPEGMHIGAYSTIAFGVTILSHDTCRLIKVDTRIGANCFIGAHSIILPGVTIGDQSIVAAGSVVNRDVPPNSIVAGNPAKVIRSGIETNRYGVLKEEYR
ncbi:acyltransferase [Erythrobacter donghaensis]|uniref:acyltransferase n=1 Tax=Erythrobacter donghaensis TaxID=267135 RepID=UPI0024820EE0|nr:acyltransferase [Erythrobacter donghaensis]